MISLSPAAAAVFAVVLLASVHLMMVCLTYPNLRIVQDNTTIMYICIYIITYVFV